MVQLRKLLCLVACGGAQAAQLRGDRTITQVVSLLQEMLDKSKAEAQTERTLYGKYKCYCDTNEEEKDAEVTRLQKQVPLLQNAIDDTLASSASLSAEVAKLKQDMAANVEARSAADTLRGQENQEFLALETDLDMSEKTAQDAIDVLAAVGADQTFSVGADHTQYMANANVQMVALRNSLKQVLVAASAFVNKKQALVVDAFLQSPFTGTYTAQSGEVVGILKQMRKTMLAELADARAAEAKAVTAHSGYTTNMVSAHALLQSSHDEKNLELAGNDGSLATKRSELDTAQGDLTAAQSFLSSLLEMCSAKAKQYDDRVALRTKEDSAIAEAISILNSDAAFASFGMVSATKDGPVSFLQGSAVHAHLQQLQESPRQKARAFLERAAGKKSSPLLKHVISLLQANNPFSVVLAEIDKMIALMAAEETADDQQKGWCDTTRTETDGTISTKSGQITSLQGEINQLEVDIDHPDTGLKALIVNIEASLEQNHNNQVTETDIRRTDNTAYRADVANLVEADHLLSKAIDVLHVYYAKLTAEMQGGTLLQRRRQDPTPPATWEDNFKGQSEKGGNALDMLRFILTNTKAEETQAHSDELAAQHQFEDSMQTLKDEAGTLQGSLTTQKGNLAAKSKELMEKREGLAATVKEKDALEAYLVQIKPGCDFITLNIAARKANRVDETSALTNAKTLLKATPAYTLAEAVKHNETLGDCLSKCAGNQDHVNCKACLASTSVPGYCAGHPSTAGCAVS